MNAVPGSCLCGGVRFQVEGTPVVVAHCHCSRCRKISGTDGLPSLAVPVEQLRILAGEELIGTWFPGPEPRGKAFCTQCGSSLFSGWPEGPFVAVRIGALDADPGVRPTHHIFVGSAAPWLDLPNDGLPRYEERP
jgi:hypothetical protein